MEDILDPLTYYLDHGLISTPNKYEESYQHLPTDLPGLCRTVQGLLLHEHWAARYGEDLTLERRKQSGIRQVRHILPQILALRDSPLDHPRPLSKRYIGNCRTFSVLLTSFLRYQGIAARARCGFGRYFLPGKFEDHWVCEYWNKAEDCWILVDAQLDDFQCQELKLDFDPLDVPRDQFIVAGKAWNWCREGKQDPEKFGIFDMHGMWFVRGNLVRDIASLNTVPLLPWDGWGLADQTDEQVKDSDLNLLDRVSSLTWDEVDFQSIRSIYNSERGFKVPPVITSYSQSGDQQVELEPEAVIKKRDH